MKRPELLFPALNIGLLDMLYVLKSVDPLTMRV